MWVGQPSAHGFRGLRDTMPIRSQANPPHGGRLVDLLATGEEAKALREGAASLPVVRLSSRSLSDLELLTVGVYSPLEGFMTEVDYRSVVAEMRLASGVAWPMPVTLGVSGDEAGSAGEGQEIALADETGGVLAVLEVAEKYEYDRVLEARNVYRTEDESHPGVAAVYAQGEV